jgi:hypothetical protein
MYGVRTMERTNIYLDDRELAGLRAVSRNTGRPVAALVREAVDAWLEQNGVSEIPEDEWGRRFGELLGRRGGLAATGRWSPEAVEADVQRAVAEVRSSRAARRR